MADMFSAKVTVAATFPDVRLCCVIPLHQEPGKTRVLPWSKPPLHQEPGKKSGKPGQVWFNQTYQPFVKKTSLVKSLVRLVLPGF